MNMKILALTLVSGLLATFGSMAVAQDHGHSHADGTSHGDHGHSGESIAFYMPKAKTVHFDDVNKAKQQFDTLQKLGCQVKQGGHADHIDVTYICSEWKSLKVADHGLADQWSAWLKGAGFDVSHGHLNPNFSEGPEVVEFRMDNWKQIHGNGSPEESQMLTQLKQLGCEIVVENHGNHNDIRFRAPTWHDAHFADHESAQKWASWLTQTGFQTRHSH